MEIAALTDTDLLTAWVKYRDEAAFHTLVSRYAGLVHNAAKRTCGDDSLAAEASQLAFIRLTRKANSLLPRASLGGWLYLTAMGEARNLLRSNTRENRKRSALLSTMAMHPPEEPDRSWQEIQPFLNTALAALSEKDREAIILRFYRSLSVKEIAATLGIATDAAQKRLDRATDRLRGKLTRRGVTTSGSISAVMLAGFSTDAQASVISTSLLSSKAIAASAVMPTGLFATLLAMKASSYIAPAIFFLLSGTWLISQQLKISKLNQRSDALQSSLASLSSGPIDASTTSGTSAKSAQARKPVSKLDAKALLAEYAKIGENQVAGMGYYTKYWPIFEGMSSEELGSILKDLYALGVTDKDALALANGIMPLMVKNYFIDAIEHFLPQLENVNSYEVAQGIEKYIGKDLAAATRWLDLQVAAGKLDSKSLDDPNPIRAAFESKIFTQLLISDPAAAEARLTALPEHERILLFSDRYGPTQRLTFPQLAEMSRLIRTHLPEKDQTDQIASFANRIGKARFPEVAEFLDSIQAKPIERNAIAMKFAFDYFSDKVSQSGLDEFRASMRKIAPERIDAVTGHALAAALMNGKTSFENAAALALHYHEAGAGDDILAHLCSSPGGRANKAAARLVVAKISNQKRREAILNKLK